MRRFIVAMTNQVERINVSHYATMNNKTSVKHNWRCFKSWSVIGRIESVRVQSDYVLKIQKINAMCGRASLRKLRGPAKGGWGRGCTGYAKLEPYGASFKYVGKLFCEKQPKKVCQPRKSWFCPNREFVYTWGHRILACGT